MSNSTNYLQHNTGIWAMLQFFESYLKYGYKYDVKNKTMIELSSFYSQHIAFGSTNNKKLGKNFYMLFSQQLFDSLSLIKFDKIVIDPFEQRVYLISKSVPGDGVEWPEIPAFILSIYFENIDKIHFLEEEKKIDIKPYYFTEDENECIIDHKSSFTLPIQYLNENESVYSLVPTHVQDYYSLMDATINKAIAKYSGYVPEFKGDYIESDLHKTLSQHGVFDDPKAKK